MKTKHILALLSSWILLFAVGCSKEDTPAPLSDLTIEVTMPESFEVQDVKGTFAYYWTPDMTLQFTLEQEGTVIHTDRLKPSSIASDGSTATFRISALKQGITQDKPLRIKGTVTTGSGESTTVGGGAIHLPKNWTGTLPYNLLSGIPMPLTASAEAHLDKGAGNIKLALQPQGRILLLQINNSLSSYLRLNTLSITSDKNVFFDEKARFSPESSTFVGTTSTSSAPFAFEKEDDYDGKQSKTYLLWIPTTSDYDLGSIQMTLNYQRRVSEGASSEFESESLQSETPFAVTSDTKLLVLNIISNQLLLSDQANIAPADISNGGDPFFTMDDIKFWVGEGTNRSALVIEWHDGKSPDALVWGYKWDGEKTGEDMFKAIVKADPRLSCVLGKAFGGLIAVGGIGYQFEKTTPRASVYLNNAPQANDGNGITRMDTAKDFDNFTFGDPNAHWKSGFYTNGYWVYYTKDNRSDGWAYSNIVFSQRTLTDGCWDGWSFQDGMQSFNGRPHGSIFQPALTPEK